MPGCGGAGPRTYLGDDVAVLPEPHNNFPVQLHPGPDKPEFAICVRGLIQVHEIHINGGPWQAAIVLSVEMRKRLHQCF